MAQERVTQAGMADGVELRLADYREVEGQYDAIVSVEMIEAVGEQYWPTYFATIDRLLAPGGKVSIQAITMSHERMLETGVRSAGSRSTSSPVASSLPCRPSTSPSRSTRPFAFLTDASSARTTPRR